MHRRLHNNDFDILLWIFHLSAKLQIPKIDKKYSKNYKWYLYNTSRVFGFSYYKLYLAQNLQLCFGTSQSMSPETCKYMGRSQMC